MTLYISITIATPRSVYEMQIIVKVSLQNKWRPAASISVFLPAFIGNEKIQKLRLIQTKRNI